METYEENDITEAAKKATARVQIDDEVKKGDTQRVAAATDADLLESAKRKTSKIDMGTILDEDEEEDIFKRRTAVLDASKLPQSNQTGPRTIRIKRPGATPPSTTILKADSNPGYTTYESISG